MLLIYQELIHHKEDIWHKNAEATLKFSIYPNGQLQNIPYGSQNPLIYYISLTTLMLFRFVLGMLCIFKDDTTPI